MLHMCYKGFRLAIIEIIKKLAQTRFRKSLILNFILISQ
jgi:hypothetical protein